MQVKFHTNLYTLTDNGISQTNQPDGSNVLALDLTGVTDTTALTEDATDAEDIIILNGDSIYQEYLDYTALRSVVLDAETEIVTVTVRQESLVKQVETLRERNKALKAQVALQADVIDRQSVVIAEQAEQIRALEASQAEQDDEITEIQEVLVEE